jgi:hypothetical protein
MNLNSLIIVADSSRARMFRTAQTTDSAAPFELIELNTVELSEFGGTGSRTENHSALDRAVAPLSHTAPDKTRRHQDNLLRFAHEVAQRAAEFARYHVCNPVVVAANDEVLTVLLTALEREIPNTYVRSICEELTDLSPSALLLDLQKRHALAATQYPVRA